MKDYIEREQAITVFKTFYGKSLRVVLEALEEEHAADVREVVLCRDCKWWRGEGTICKGIGIDFDADGFCCEGERKDGAEMKGEADGT